jgi:hypothetical protein
MSAFERSIGIDYSGAETSTASLRGLRVYMAEGDTPPAEVPPPPSAPSMKSPAAPPRARTRKRTKLVNAPNRKTFWEVPPLSSSHRLARRAEHSPQWNSVCAAVAAEKRGRSHVRAVAIAVLGRPTTMLRRPGQRHHAGAAAEPAQKEFRK